MKRIIKIVLVLLSAALPTIYACSQPSPRPAGPPVAGPTGPGSILPQPSAGPYGPDRPADRPVQQLVTIQGTITGYTASDSNQYDGLIVQNGGQSVHIRFAPRLAAQLMAEAKAGTSISVQGFYETTPDGMNVIHLVNATSGNQAIYDGPPPAPANPPAETFLPFSGTVTDLRRDREGIPNGILLSDGLVIALQPGVYDQLQAYLKPGKTVSGSGARLTPPAGVVLVQHTQIVQPQTLTVNGQTYMVR